MTRRMLARRLSCLRGERGFTIVETIVALGVIFASLASVAFTVTAGLNYIGLSRHRLQATGLANKIIEEVRALPYTSVVRGMSSADLTGDTNIVLCGSTYRFKSCSGDKLVISTFVGGYTADWLVPHSGTESLESITATWKAYVTNPDPTSEPYTVTAIVSWTGGSIGPNSNNVVQVQTKFWSPTGCVSSALHPFAAPCQPFFYGLAEVPTGAISISGDMHLGTVDFAGGRISLTGAKASGQQEQLTDAGSTVTASAASIDDSTGTTTGGGDQVSRDADSDPSSPTPSVAGGPLTGSGVSQQRLQPDCCNDIGITLTVPSGDVGNANASVAATSADAYPCPPVGTRETDALDCAGAYALQTGTLLAHLAFRHVVSPLGDADLIRITAPVTGTSADVDRDAVPGYQGLIDVSAKRYLGNVYLGGFPTAGMTAPAGMSTNAALDTNYCLRITGYTEQAHVLVGERTSTAPSNSVTGTIYYYNGAGYSSKAVTDTTMSTVSVNCTTTQSVGGKSVTWRAQVLVGGLAAATSPTPTATVDPGDSQTRSEAKAITTPIAVTLHYYLIVDGSYEVDLVVSTDLGSLLATGTYGEPPPTQGG